MSCVPRLPSAKPGEQLHCKKLPFLRNVVTVGFEHAWLPHLR